MKGKKIFTQKEVDKILKLIAEKLKADRTSQKRIRNKIRALGFYYSDFSLNKRPGGYNQNDFLSLIKIKG